MIILPETSHSERHGYFLARKFLVLAPVALSRSFITRSFVQVRAATATWRQFFRNLAQGDGPSRAIRQQANMRVDKRMPARSGFVALMTSIILSVILITVAVALNQVGFITRSEILDSEYKERSSALAEGCMDEALLKLAYDSDPTHILPNTVITVNNPDTCSIISVTGTTQFTINTSAAFPASSVTDKGAFTRLKVVVNSSDMSVISWDELP